MHRCLFVSEIVSVILDDIHHFDGSFDRTEERRLGQRTLVSLAQTCRTLSSPALDQLWACLESLDPFLRLLPRSMWGHPSLIIVALIRIFMGKRYWFHFREYAVRVRYLNVPLLHRVPPSVQRNVINAFASLRGASHPFLPNLKLLVWNNSSDADVSLSFIRFFVGPALTNLSLYFQGWPKRCSSRAILSKLPTSCPNVTSLTIVYDPEITTFPECIGNLVQGWPQLQDLHASPLFRPQLTALDSKKALRTLAIELETSTYLFVGQLPDGIDTLSLHALHPAYVVDYLETLRGSPTNLVLQLGILHERPMSMIDTLFTMLPRSFDNSLLHALTIDTFPQSLHALRIDPADKPHLPFTGTLLAHLYAFSELRSLDLGGVCTMDVDDAAYARMAGAWPELRSFTATAGKCEWKPAASVRGVLAVLEGCPFLERLEMLFDGSVPPPRPMMVSGPGDLRPTASWGVSNPHLTQINVGRSPIGEREGVAVDVVMKELGVCLGTVMPRLERIQYDEVRRMAFRWRIVQEIVEMRCEPSRPDPGSGSGSGSGSSST